MGKPGCFDSWFTRFYDKREADKEAYKKEGKYNQEAYIGTTVERIKGRKEDFDT